MTRSLGDRITRMKTAVEAGRQAADLPPHLQQQLTALVAAVQQLETLNQEQEVLKGQLQAATAAVQAQDTATTDLYRRLVLALKAHYGPRSQQLEVFGVVVKT
jgi:hypothetical protein